MSPPLIVPEFTYNRVLHFALQRNQVPVAKSLVLANPTEEDWNQLRISLVMDPELAEPVSLQIDCLPAGSSTVWSPIHIEMRSAALAELTEKISAQLILKVEREGTEIWEKRYPLDVLAYDQWHGLGVLPEMLSAFVTPNYPDLTKVKQRASVILEDWTGDGSLDGYQSRSKDRVRKQMAAIYQAIAEMDIVYCTAPASFEPSGQRIRMADALVSGKMGNCLDMSLFYASCLESIGLNPLIVALEGHALAGAWLVDETFLDSAMDDSALLINRIRTGVDEINLVEATGMNKGKNLSFDQSVDWAERTLVQSPSFETVIDVRRARSARILPMPLKAELGRAMDIEEETPEGKAVIDAPRSLGESEGYGDRGSKAETKLQLWERKLLDLSLRNKLLNLKVRKDTIPIGGVSPSDLEDALASGQDFRILPYPRDWDSQIRSSELYQALHSHDPFGELAREEINKNRLRSFLPQEDLEKRLTNLYRTSRTALEENGANTLFIALGCLKWFETQRSEMPRLAPILLLPVELIRKSSQSGYVVRTRDEAPMLNISLVEKLKTDFDLEIQGLDELPEDKSGIDVQAIFNRFRQSIKHMGRWQVEDIVVLETFSFNRFILWHDLHRHAEVLAKNKMVSSLMEGRLVWEAEPERERNLDEEIAPESLPLPIATDSAQLEAIVSSTEGRSFVLHGPPGTGKSQTITNMIAAALYGEKRVLFVASKKAALEVVQSRMEKLGLGAFCLELHSNKAKKSTVLDQLDRALQVGQISTPREFQLEADRLRKLRDELNGYVKALHKVWPCGLSLYDGISGYLDQGPGEPAFDFPHTRIGSLSLEQSRDWETIISDMKVILRTIGNPSTHPLSKVKWKQYDLSFRDQLRNRLKGYLSALEEWERGWEENLNLLSLEGKPIRNSQWPILMNLVSEILTLPDIPASFFSMDSAVQRMKQIRELVRHGRLRDEKRAWLLQYFGEGVFNLDAESLLHAWNRASSQWFLPRYFGQRKVIKSLMPHMRNAIGQKEDIPQHIQSLVDYQKEDEFILKPGEVRQIMGWWWREQGADWDGWEHACVRMENILKWAGQLLEPAALTNWRKKWANSLGEGTGSYLTAYGERLRLWRDNWEYLNARARELALYIDLDSSQSELESGEWLQRTIQEIRHAENHLDKLKDWMNWVEIRDRAMQSGMVSLIEAVHSGAVGAENIERQYRKAFYKSLSEHGMNQFPELVRFNSDLFENKIVQFQEASQRFEILSREEIFARLARRVPPVYKEIRNESEVAVLQRAIRSKGRALTIRSLFDRISNLLPRLAPCMLMSPISVAQYFDLQEDRFDLVIFDEASQMPTFEAISAMARGKNLIVVGDPKQMPPTSFFTISRVDEDNEMEDLESILDDCVAVSMPSKHLRWHYRSKHESLIAFSNAHYYDNSLYTFPSIDDLVSRVSMQKVQGEYDKGKSRTNRKEAQEVVHEILRRLSDPELSSQSLGVVTFSQAQQNLIEDLLMEEFMRNPELEAQAMDSEEPLFIKNLENVQGDERDVILFSVCYGPDKEGKLSLNFGPLNREGGERRLNVAVTRARHEMKVFSTIGAEDIDLSRTRSLGVEGLKSFLAFAEKGKSGLPLRPDQIQGNPSAMERILVESLKEKGYEAHYGVGCSGFKIDVGVLDPDRPSEYLLGILFDGARYKASGSARDRAVVQEEVLRSLGWRIHRVWAMDWWENQEALFEEVLQQIDQVRRNRDNPDLADESVPQALDRIGATDREFRSQRETLVLDSAVRLSPNSRPELGIPQNPTNKYEEIYELCTLAKDYIGSIEEFFSRAHLPKITRQVEQVLEVESPISDELLGKRIIEAWGISRLGIGIRCHIDKVLDSIPHRKTEFLGGKVLWKNTQHPNSYRWYRVPRNSAERRSPRELPPEEIAVAMKAILEEQISLPREDLIKEASRRFGFARVGINVHVFFDQSLEILANRGWGQSKENIWTLQDSRN